MFRSLALTALITTSALTLLGGCTHILQKESATRLAAPAHMITRTINTDEIAIQAFERKNKNGAPINVYIEGDSGYSSAQSRTKQYTEIITDGFAYHPLGLELATRDNNPNVVYLSRPCEFDTDPACQYKFWKGNEFSQRTISVYNQALDNIAERYGYGDINLIGYDGGGAIATILAATRDDITSLRTVAGVLDHKAQDVYLGKNAYEYSLNPVDFTDNLKGIPQHHFIGGQDPIVKPAVLHSYLNAIGDTPCVKYTFIQEAEHKDGWADKWQQLLAMDVASCEYTNDVNLDGEPFEIKEPIYVPHMTGDKK